MAVILASQSPRRKALLELFSIPFIIKAADIDETMDPSLPVEQAVALLSRRKAEAVPRTQEDTVIAADTIVVLDGTILGKPTDEADAYRMLSRLSGRTHQVMTGMTVLQGNKCVSCTEIADVTFRPVSEKEILSYIATGDPMDKAGSYGIQSGAALFVERINGDYYNVMGLPVCRLSQILKEFLSEGGKPQ